MNITTDDRSFFQKVADWNFDLHDLVEWFQNLFFYYYDTLGWKGVVGFVFVVSLAMFFFEPTRHLISLLYNTIFRELLITPLKHLVSFLIQLLRYLWDLSISKGRDLLRLIRGPGAG